MNKNEIRLISLAGSGTPYLVKWLKQQGKYCYLNCADSGDPFLSAQFLSNGEKYEANYELDFEQECSGIFSDKDYLIHNYYDQVTKHIRSAEFEKNHDALVGESRNRYDILVIRDPISLFAHQVRNRASKKINHDITLWKQHAREYLVSNGFVKINFNLWADSLDYRKEIAKLLGCTNIDMSHIKIVEIIKKDNIDFLKIFDDEMINLSSQIFGI